MVGKRPVASISYISLFEEYVLINLFIILTGNMIYTNMDFCNRLFNFLMDLLIFFFPLSRLRFCLVKGARCINQTHFKF